MRHIRVKVFPGFKSEKVEQVALGQYKIYLREPAEQNAANKRLVQLVAELEQVPLNRLRIVSGHHQQNKILEILEP